MKKLITLVITVIMTFACAVPSFAAAICVPKQYECDGDIDVVYSVKWMDYGDNAKYDLSFSSDMYKTGKITIDGKEYDITKKYIVSSRSGIATEFTSGGETFKLAAFSSITPPPISEDMMEDDDVLSWCTAYEVIHNHKGEYEPQQKATFTSPGVTYLKCSLCGTPLPKEDIPAIGESLIKLKFTKATYTGKRIRPSLVISSKYRKFITPAGSSIDIKYYNNLKAGNARAVVSFPEDHPFYSGQRTYRFTVEKANSGMGISISNVFLKKKKGDLKTKTQTIKLSKYAKIKGNKGDVTFKKTSGNSGIKVNEKTGNITLKKGFKPGSYTITVRFRDNGTENYNPKAVSKKVHVRVTSY